MTDVKLKLAPPWVTFVNEIKALFGQDPQVRVVYDNEKDVYGNITTLYQEIASDVFDVLWEPVFYCTDIKRDLDDERCWP